MLLVHCLAVEISMLQHVVQTLQVYTLILFQNFWAIRYELKVVTNFFLLCGDKYQTNFISTSSTTPLLTYVYDTFFTFTFIIPDP
jgi:hypothetical protein